MRHRRRCLFFMRIKTTKGVKYIKATNIDCKACEKFYRDLSNGAIKPRED